MRPCFNLFLCAFTVLAITACAQANPPISTASPVPSGPEIHGVFKGNTPCSAQARALPQIPSDADCEQMIWNLVLYQDPETGAPTIYRLESAYGLSKPNTNDLLNGGRHISMEGTWTITTGTKNDPEAIVYQLNPNDPQTTVSFLKVNDNLLHVLNNENPFWSETAHGVIP